MKKKILLCVIAGFVCGVLAHILMRASEPQEQHDIVVLYDNDVHCAVDGYAVMAGLRDSMLGTTPNVTTISMGDFAQGDLVGTLSEGMDVVKIMNSVPYDITTIGNHEFDYSIAGLERICAALTAEVVCCNFSHADGRDIFPAYTLRNYDGRRVAYIGAATPTTYNTSTPTYFQDSVGNVIYDFHTTDTYARIQQAADRARSEGADYVIVMSHLGDEVECAYSTELIQKTHGIDVVLDGHSHHLINTRIANDRGDSVYLASTGTKFQYIGMLRIDTKGQISVENIPTATLTSLKSRRVSVVIDSVMTRINETAGQIIGTTEQGLSDSRNGQRIVRREQAEIGRFLADAFRSAAGAEIGIVNGGGIRKAFAPGEVTLGNIISVIPFNNRIWRMRATGQQILDALEVGVKKWPDEDGDYPHVVGLRYSINAAVPSSVILDENNMFVGIGKTRRIRQVEVERNGVWTQIDPNATYTIGGQSYILRSGGSSGAYMQWAADAGPMMTDVEAVVNFIRSGNAARYHVLPQ